MNVRPWPFAINYPWTVRKVCSGIIFSQTGRKLAEKDKNEGNYPV